MLRVLSLVLVLLVVSSAHAQDWVIGDDDPNETVILTSDTFINGNLILINNGHLIVQPGITLTIEGDVTATSTSTLEVDQGTVVMNQAYEYQHIFIIMDDATFLFSGATISSSDQSISIAMTGNTHVSFTNVTTVHGFLTWSLFQSSTATLDGCTTTGEFLCLSDAVVLDIANSSSVIFWLVMPDGSIVDTTMPAPGDVPSFHVGPDVSWASGIGYSATLTNCTDTQFGLMARSGSSSTFHNTQFRAAGSYFEHDNTVLVQGVADQTFMNDVAYQWGDISLHFLNSSVDAWNYYAAGNTNLTLRSCIFGEALTSDTAQTLIEESLCDGRGGYIGAENQSTVLFVNSMNLSQTNLSDQAVFIAANSSMLNPEVNASDDSRLVLVNSRTLGEPEAFDSGTIFDGSIEPVEGLVDDMVSIRGSARRIAGPTSSWQYDGYSLDYSTDDGQTFVSITGIIADSVHQATLTEWDTTGLTQGAYTLRLNLHHTSGEPIQIYGFARLDAHCLADFNLDGQVNTSDILDFLNAWSAQDPKADFNNDGLINTIDVLAFLNAWTSGCP